MRRGRRIIAVLVAALVIAAAGVAAAYVLRPAAVPEPEPAGEPATEETQEPEPEPEAPTVVEESATPVTMAEAPTRTTATDDGLTVTAPDAFLATDELAAVSAAIDQLEQERGASVSVVLLDLQTRRGITYNADVARYPASSIKAVYCAYVCESAGGPGALAATMESCLVNSDNDAYHELLDTFGLGAWPGWLTAHGAPVTARRAGAYYYPETTASELATIWEEIWRYGTSGEKGGAELASCLARTNHSPIGAELRDACEVWAKPGWYPADGSGLEATNDAGVVFSAEGPYVMVVMTDLSSDLDALRPLIDALDAAHTCMCGDTVAYYE